VYPLQETVFDDEGDRVGYVHHDDDWARAFDEDNKYLGFVRRDGKKDNIFDPDGDYLGYVELGKDKDKIFSKDGKYIGSAKHEKDWYPVFTADGGYVGAWGNVSESRGSALNAGGAALLLLTSGLIEESRLGESQDKGCTPILVLLASVLVVSAGTIGWAYSGT
jgi:hypothetical protein